MNRREAEEYLYCAMSIGEQLLVSGAEVGRVEDTIRRICLAYGAERADVFSITSSIVTTIYGADFGVCTQTRRVSGMVNDLDRVDQLNQLSREICSHECSLRDAWVRLEECKSIPKNKNWVEIFFCGVGSAGFCYLFGGTALDSFVAFFIGLVLQIFLIASDRHLESKFITNILGSGIVTFLSLIVLSAGIPILQDKVVIGDIMPLVPGIALTTSIRDFFNGDYLSGAIHMIDAILTAFSIAVGVGAVITLYQLVTGGALLR